MHGKGGITVEATKAERARRPQPSWRQAQTIQGGKRCVTRYLQAFSVGMTSSISINRDDMGKPSGGFDESTSASGSTTARTFR
jgi:hypothetical protein